MADFSKVEKALKARGYAVKIFSTKEEAAEYVDSAIDGLSVGIGGSGTVQALGLYEKLDKHNNVVWHWKEDPATARRAAMTADVYLSSANALAETGEIVNIDGVGNRLAGTLFGHKKIYFIIGRNKLTPDYESAVARARSVAAPRRAQQMSRKTPCAAEAARCFDCRAEERICRGMTTLWGPMMGMEAEVILIDEELGL